jgi:hypothetical protein
MNTHPYLRAYLAGICVPTIFLLFVATGFTFIRYVYNFPVPIERVIVFPMAVVPNLWGLWNILFVSFLARRRFSIGLFGAFLPLLLAPLGYSVAHLLQFPIPPHVLAAAPVGLPIGMILYYLVWKHLVSSLNAELAIA